MDLKFAGFLACCIGAAGCTAQGDWVGTAIALSAAAVMAWIIKDTEKIP